MPVSRFGEADVSETFTPEELARCAEREVRQRSRVYPRLVMSGKMRSEQAQRESAMMQEIARMLRAEADGMPGASGKML